MTPEPMLEGMIENALFAVNPNVSKATADYARAACWNLATTMEAARRPDPEAVMLREALEDARNVLRHGSSQSARMLLAKIDAALNPSPALVSDHE